MTANTYCEIDLIRHGETEWNALDILQGHLDIPLSERGVKQAELLQKTLSLVEFSEVFSSDLKRSHTTAKVVLGTRKIEIHDTQELRERNMRQWEGHKRSELRSFVEKHGVLPIQPTREEALTYSIPGGIESYAQVYDRFTTFLLPKITPNLGKAILVSSHGGILRSVLNTLDFRPGFHWAVPNCSLLKLHANKDGTIRIVDMQGPHPEVPTIVNW
jgi:2,3-bisphosphoglycerate-dependent phosphoglycerate mutase